MRTQRPSLANCSSATARSRFTKSVEVDELALVAQALMHFLESQEVPVGLREYFRLVDAPAAHAIIDQLLDAHVDPRSVDRVASLMAGAGLLGDAYTASLPRGAAIASASTTPRRGLLNGLSKDTHPTRVWFLIPHVVMLASL